MVVARDVDLLAVQRVDACIIHDRRGRTRRGVIVLHLLGRVAVALEAERETYRALERGAGMAAHQIGDEVLLQPAFLRQAEILLAERLIHLERRLAHQAQHAVVAVLGRDLELTADVIAHQLAEEGVALVAEHVVKADARADEHLFHLRQRLDRAEQLDVLAVVGDEVLAGRGRKAFPPGADAVGELFFARTVAEIGGRAADVVDVALEIRHFGDELRLADDRLDAARPHGAPLVERERAEVAAAEAAAVVRDREAHLLDGGDAAVLCVHGMPGAHIGERVHPIQLLALERGHGRVLHQHLVAVVLEDRLAVDGVLVAVLDAVGVGIGAFVGLQRIVVIGFDRGKMHLFALFDEEDRAAHVADLADRHAAVEQLGHGDEDFLAHAVGNHVGAAVHEQGAAHPVVPVVVVREAAQRRLQPAEDDRNIAVGLADAVGLDDGGAVGAQSHGVDVARADEEAEARPPERAERLRRAEVRLCQKADAEARVLEHARDDRRAEGRMIHIGVAVDIDEIDLAPAPRLHLGAVHRQKLLFHHDKNSGETFLTKKFPHTLSKNFEEEM